MSELLQAQVVVQKTIVSTGKIVYTNDWILVKITVPVCFKMKAWFCRDRGFENCTGNVRTVDTCISFGILDWIDTVNSYPKARDIYRTFEM
jgi:hypothetical protein